MDRRLLERTVELATKTRGFDPKKTPKTLPLEVGRLLGLFAAAAAFTVEGALPPAWVLPVMVVLLGSAAWALCLSPAPRPTEPEC